MMFIYGYCSTHTATGGDAASAEVRRGNAHKMDCKLHIADDWQEQQSSSSALLIRLTNKHAPVPFSINKLRRSKQCFTKCDYSLPNTNTQLFVRLKVIDNPAEN